MNATDTKQKVPARAEIVTIIQRLAPELKRRGVASISLFGSVLHDTASISSDVDLLLDLKSGVKISLLERLYLRDLIADELGHPVDLIPRTSLIQPLRHRIEQEAELIFS